MRIEITQHGETAVVASYDDITTSTAYDFMILAANKFAEGRTDVVRMVINGGKLSGNADAVMLDIANLPIARFTQVWDIPQGSYQAGEAVYVDTWISGRHYEQNGTVIADTGDCVRVKLEGIPGEFLVPYPDCYPESDE